jgi:hypothetical protein
LATANYGALGRHPARIITVAVLICLALALLKAGCDCCAPEGTEALDRPRAPAPDRI